ncbi:YheC/YheD family protein [Anaerobranca californiensis]|jgi:glutathione synthase/RimK-type ligase-like ATP-grasp enzyme|nr:YheC/YheD family protein [Anaerobranca californiensis]
MRGQENFKKIYKEFQDIPFTHERIGGSLNKLTAYNMIVADGRFNEYIIPYRPLDNLDALLKFLELYGKVIVKLVSGSYGQSIILVEQYNDYYKLSEGQKSVLANKHDFLAFINKLVKNGQFVVQQYIKSRTLANAPFDIRVRLVKNREGKWTIVKIYPRVGDINAIATNIASGAAMKEWDIFFKNNFPHEDFEKTNQRLQKFSIEFSRCFQEMIKDNLDDIGLDIAIDSNMKFWLIEVNVNRVATSFIEFEVAEHAIPYAVSLVRKRYK